jgi:hypothetical protein
MYTLCVVFAVLFAKRTCSQSSGCYCKGTVYPCDSFSYGGGSSPDCSGGGQCCYRTCIYGNDVRNCGTALGCFERLTQTVTNPSSQWPSTGCDAVRVTDTFDRCTDGCEDCKVSLPEWSSCSVTCGSGVQTRTPTILATQVGSGKYCDLSTQSRPCVPLPPPCPQSCRLSIWSDWSKCSSTCLPALRTRVRTVLESAKFGGSCEQLNAYDDCKTVLKDCGGQAVTLPILTSSVALTASSVPSELSPTLSKVASPCVNLNHIDCSSAGCLWCAVENGTGFCSNAAAACLLFANASVTTIPDEPTETTLSSPAPTDAKIDVGLIAGVSGGSITIALVIGLAIYFLRKRFRVAQTTSQVPLYAFDAGNNGGIVHSHQRGADFHPGNHGDSYSRLSGAETGAPTSGYVSHTTPTSGYVQRGADFHPGNHGDSYSRLSGAETGAPTSGYVSHTTPTSGYVQRGADFHPGNHGDSYSRLSGAETGAPTSGYVSHTTPTSGYVQRGADFHPGNHGDSYSRLSGAETGAPTSGYVSHTTPTSGYVQRGADFHPGNLPL